MSCISCGRELHEECLQQPCCCEDGPKQETRPQRDDVTISAGRKRAAKLYPLDQNAECEWRGKKNCGGGKHPIIGCMHGYQRSRHHGPVKTTTNNDEGNVHRICTSCHNRWHTLNDPDYGYEEASGLKHNPEPATIDELFDNETFWKSNKRSVGQKRITNDD